MAEDQSLFRVHTTPIGKNVGEPLAEINRRDFDFKSHFKRDLLVASGQWWAVQKTKPWSVLDCMVVDSDDDVRSSFSQFSLEEVASLFVLANKIARIEKKGGAEKLLIGANINHEKHNTHLDKVLLRLHLHVVGFLPEEMAAMRELPVRELKEKGDGVMDFLFDPQLERFQKEMTACYPDEAINSSLGVSFEFVSDSLSAPSNSFYEFVLDLDKKISEIFPGLSYSFCVEGIGTVNLRLTVSPRSIFGKGVLESVGIILRRDENKEISSENLAKRNKLFKKIKEIK